MPQGALFIVVALTHRYFAPGWFGGHDVGYEGHQSTKISLRNKAFVHAVQIYLRGRLVHTVFGPTWPEHPVFVWILDDGPNCKVFHWYAEHGRAIFSIFRGANNSFPRGDGVHHQFKDGLASEHVRVRS